MEYSSATFSQMKKIVKKGVRLSPSFQNIEMTLREAAFLNPKDGIPMKNCEIGSFSRLEDESDVDILNPGHEISEVSPRVKIGDDGKIVIDPLSLSRIPTSRQMPDQNLKKISQKDARKRCPPWDCKSTVKFYTSLFLHGTNFANICAEFPLRTRRNLKLKYKKETKINSQFIDKVIGSKKCRADLDEVVRLLKKSFNKM
ncbi:SANT [Nesidiocoris tenuis]|uniref:SANT n=1 Tax=Nesidiocoris tenuis TaxID=355587 RepID=A0ABN7AN22_9HEMI|nr:SANT [Nesidiocoris tenuis]